MSNPSLYGAYVRQDRPRKEAAQVTDAAEVAVDSLVPVDWLAVLQELNASGHSDRQVAITIDVPTSTLRRWKTGSIPNFESGRKLLAMLRQVRNCAMSSAREGV